MQILLVEDNPVDVIVIREVLENSGISVTVHVCENGDEAIDYMRDRINKPDLILLDLTIPGKTGKEVLKEFKKDSDFNSVPVVVVSGSKSEEDIADVYRLGANCFHTKPANFEKFVDMIHEIMDFWFKTANLDTKRELCN